jgi:hypothetical protein
MRFSLSRQLREVWKGDAGARARATSRRSRTLAVGASLEGLEERKLLSLAGVAIAEGNINQATFHVRLPFAPRSTFLANANTFDGGATKGKDYVPVTNKVLTFGPATTLQNVTVMTLANPAFKHIRKFGLQVTVPDRNRYGVATIVTPFPNLPHVAVTNPTIVQSGTGTGTYTATFFVHLSRAPRKPLTFTVKTDNESAKAGTDYLPTPNPSSLTFSPGGPTTATVTVPVIAQAGFHPRKRFLLELDNPLRVAFGVATIRWIHPANPIPQVSNPVVLQTGTT